MHRSMSAEIREELKGREEEGLQKYGKPVHPFNGRRPARDRVQELLDATVYAKQDDVERTLTVDGIRHWTEFLGRVKTWNKRDMRVGISNAMMALNDLAARLDEDVPRTGAPDPRKAFGHEQGPFESALNPDEMANLTPNGGLGCFYIDEFRGRGPFKEVFGTEPATCSAENCECVPVPAEESVPTFMGRFSIADLSHKEFCKGNPGSLCNCDNRCVFTK